MSSALILVRPAHQSPEECFVWELGVGSRHGIAAQQKTVRLRAGKEAMEEKSVSAMGEHDFTAAHLVNRAARDLDDIVRPKSGQHALPSDLQTQTAARAQIVYS